MAKRASKSRKRRNGSKGTSGGEEGAGPSGAGDLRRVDTLVADLIGGNEEARAALIELGRDASMTVMRLGEKHKDDAIREFGRRLAVLPPRVKTNMSTLRASSVMELLSAAKRTAENATEATDVEVPGGAIAIFDPQRVCDSLVKGGRPRRELDRLQVGDLAWWSVDPYEAAHVVLKSTPPPEGQSTLRLRLRVDSGIVFVGPPRASDGPRIGSIRLDPHSTSLHEELPHGRLLRLAAGTYDVHVFRASDDTLRVHLLRLEDGDPRSLTLDFGVLAAVPAQAFKPVANPDADS